MSDTDGVSEDPRYDSVMDGYMSEDGLYARNHAQVKYSRSVGRHLRGIFFRDVMEKIVEKRLSLLYVRKCPSEVQKEVPSLPFSSNARHHSAGRSLRRC